MPLPGIPTAFRVFEGLAGMFFLGFETQPTAFGGQKNYGFSIMKFDGSPPITFNNAHLDRIFDIEYCMFNNLHVFFTIGGDSKVKAFTLGPDQNSLLPQGE